MPSKSTFTTGKFTSVIPEKGNFYKKADLIKNLRGPNYRPATYHDPNRDELYIFFDQRSEKYSNDWNEVEHLLIYSHKDGTPPKEIQEWMLDKVRHVFLRPDKKGEEKYEYLGTIDGGEYISEGDHTEIRLTIKEL